MRKLLVGASRRILQNNSPANALKKWGQKKIKRLGKNRSAIALARKLSVIMTAIMIAQTAYAEPATLPPSQGVNFSIQELARLNDLAQKNGKIAVKSIKRLKKLAQSA